MDVRCEKCQTEYELDEARLKPGGVTVKCTNCGHMFKIRKRNATNVGAVASTEKPTQVGKVPAPAPPVVRTPPPSEPSPRDSAAFDEPTRTGDGPADERQWLIRLESGEQKSCRELAVLQQWIVGGVVTREALISRTGKTWKRIGDITELAQYFAIADEARSKRQERATAQSKPLTGPQTMLGVGLAPSAAGGTILPDDEDVRTTGNYRALERRKREGTPPPPPPRATAEDALATTQPAPSPSSTGARRPTTQPPPVPVKKEPERAKGPSVPAGNRATATWATDGVAPTATDEGGPTGPLSGKIKALTEPAFAGRVRVEPGESTAFRSGGKVTFEEDEDVMPPRKGSKAGWIMLVVLLLAGGGAAAAYFLVFRDKGGTQQAVTPASDAAVVAQASDAGATAPPPVEIDAPAAPVTGPLELARAELAGDREAKLREALASISTVKDPGADALRAYLTASIAQQLLDRAQVTADKAEADKLKKEAKTVITDALGPAQKAVQAAPDDVTANLAMAAVLRVQGKSARDLKKYLDAAKAKATPELKSDVALAEALVLARDGKLADAKALLEPVQAGDDARVPLRRALIAYAQNKPDEAKPLVDNVLALVPDHATAKALSDRLQTTVAKTDPLPPEDNPPPNTGSGGTKPPPNTNPTPVAVPGDSYDKLLAKANDLAERNCTQAMDLFGKALEQKPNGVEALTGMGYCHIDAKQFAAAYSKFRAALAVSSRYEPALWGVAETYLQQGRKEQALDAVKAYIEVHGETPKAKKALERLQPPADAPSNGGGSSTPTTPPADPTPAPAPTPAPSEGAGSGSG